MKTDTTLATTERSNLTRGAILAISAALILLTLPLTGCSATDRATPVITRTVEIRERDRPLVSTPGSEYTITLRGRVTDAKTGELIPGATILVVTVIGTYEYTGGRFEISFPAHTVVDIRAQALGYESASEQLKAHYDRNATLEMEIKLEPKGMMEM